MSAMASLLRPTFVRPASVETALECEEPRPCPCAGGGDVVVRRMDTPPVHDARQHRSSQPGLARPEEPVDVRADGTVFGEDADSIESLSPDQHRRGEPGIDDAFLDRVAALECVVDLGVVELLCLPE